MNEGVVMAARGVTCWLAWTESWLAGSRFQIEENEGNIRDGEPLRREQREHGISDGVTRDRQAGEGRGKQTNSEANNARCFLIAACRALWPVT